MPAATRAPRLGRELVSSPEREHLRFAAALSVLGALGPDETIGLLKQRLDLLDTELAADRAQLLREAAEIPRLFLVESEYELAIRVAEADWVRAFLAELTTGTFPHLDDWRAFHLTGEAPQELIDLAERGSTPD